MDRLLRQALIAVTLALAVLLLGSPRVLAQADAAAQKKAVDDLMRSAQQSEMLGYVFAGLGLLLVVAAIPVAIYLERRRKRPLE
jgi:hypothetical protein